MIDKIKLRRAVLKLRAVDHTLRQKIMEYISEEGPATVTDLYIFLARKGLAKEPNEVSQQLAIMRREKVVKSERHGKFIEYRLNLDTLYTISKVSKALAEGYHQYETA